MDKTLAAKIKQLSKKSPLGRSLPKGYYWEYRIVGSMVFTESKVFHDMVVALGVEACWV